MQDSEFELSEHVFDTRYFSFSRDSISSQLPVDIFFGGLEHCNEDYKIDRKGFPVFLMEYVVRGEGTLILDGEQYSLRPGCLYWYGPDIPCRLVNNPERSMVKYFFAFRCPDGSPESIYGMQRRFIGSNRGGELVGNLVEMLFQEGCSASHASWRICCGFLDIILMKCARSEVLEKHAKEKAWHVFKKVKEYIEDNYLDLYRLEDIAGAVGLSCSYISRLFKQYHHMTPYSFLIQKKMEYALDLLRQQNMSVQQAAVMSGIDDPFHFSRLFKKFKGINPSEVRNVFG